MMRKLYFSFTTLMGRLYRGQITVSDLDTAIFFMCRSFENLKNVRSREMWAAIAGCDQARAVGIHAELVAALIKAEREKRARFGMEQRYGHLNSLLDGVGCPSIFRTECRRHEMEDRMVVIGPTHRIEYEYLRKMLAASCPEVELAET